MGGKEWFLWLALLFGFTSLIVETDSCFVFNAFGRKQVQVRCLQGLRQHCLSLVHSFNSLKLTFGYREANHAADVLAKQAVLRQHGFVVYIVCPAP